MGYEVIDGKGIIPDGTTEIAFQAFKGCNSLQSIEIPDSVTQIDGSVFFRCNNLTSIIVSKNNSRYKSTNNCILTKDGKKLVLCRNHNIPDNVTMIEEWAFYGCTSLQSIVIPNSVTEIGVRAFSGCTSLQSIVIPDSVTQIGELAFSDCSSVQSIIIPDSVTRIERGAFCNCTSLQSIKIPDSVTQIGESAFACCSSLQSIEIVTQEKEPALSHKRIEYLLQALPTYSKEISLSVPIGCGYAYRHYPAFEGKFKDIIADIDV